MGRKVAICTPMHGDAKAGYVDSLAGLLLAGTRDGHDLRFCRCASSSIVRARAELVRVALEWGADYLLWLDSDQTFPAHTLSRLLAIGRPIVGCNISTRTAPLRPTARDKADRLVFTDADQAARNVVQEVGLLGFGVMLTAAKVFRDIPEPWFLMPNEGGTIIGEDYYFCRQARAAGYKVYVDHGLSVHVGHIGEKVFMIEDALPAEAARGAGPG
jgi:hypothetical protein